MKNWQIIAGYFVLIWLATVISYWFESSWQHSQFFSFLIVATIRTFFLGLVFIFVWMACQGIQAILVRKIHLVYQISLGTFVFWGLSSLIDLREDHSPGFSFSLGGEVMVEGGARTEAGWNWVYQLIWEDFLRTLFIALILLATHQIWRYFRPRLRKICAD